MVSVHLLALPANGFCCEHLESPVTYLAGHSCVTDAYFDGYLINHLANRSDVSRAFWGQTRNFTSRTLRTVIEFSILALPVSSCGLKLSNDVVGKAVNTAYRLGCNVSSNDRNGLRQAIPSVN